VFQSDALFPNLTVAGNLAFGLRVGGMAPTDIDRRVDEMLQMVGLSGFGDRCTFQLSGGQQQRVALARAIAPRARAAAGRAAVGAGCENPPQPAV
jgi:putative spermidine/putrescine transport system ATP-binding protein